MSSCRARWLNRHRAQSLTIFYKERYNRGFRVCIGGASMGMLKGKQVFFVLLLSLFTVACAAPSKFYRASLGENLHAGMTQEAVKKELGEPSGFHRRQITPDELREVWVYHAQDRDLLTNHLYPKLHLIIFSNGVMLATDPHNPYAPRNQF